MSDTPAERIDRWLGPSDVARAVGLSRSTIYRLRKAGTFPPGVELAPGRVRWRASDVARWQAEQVAAAPALVGRAPTPASLRSG